MANLFQKSCCNFSRYLIISKHLSATKTCPKYCLLTKSVQNIFGRERYFHLERKYRIFLTLGAVHKQPGIKCIHTTTAGFGIEEFFPQGVLENQQPLPEEVKSGRSWRAAELRQKSNEDLHKLWYVLLKERNMLLTVQEEAKRQEVIMPSPERLHKVKKSMAMIKVVLDERKRAIEAIASNYKKAEKNAVELTDYDSSDDNHRAIKDFHQQAVTT